VLTFSFNIAGDFNSVEKVVVLSGKKNNSRRQTTTAVDIHKRKMERTKLK